MKIEGARVVGLLLLWIAVGFLFDAATAEVQYDALREAAPGDEVPPPHLFYRVTNAGTGVVLATFGLFLLVRDPGAGRTPGVPLGQESVDDDAPRRCWQCRKRWPPKAQACPHCGAERLR